MKSMKAMVLELPGTELVYQNVPMPTPLSNQVLVKVIATGICRTDLHIVDGELIHPKLPLIVGHEIIGQVIETGLKVKKLKKGDLIGIPWLAHTCGKCRYCKSGQENLCDNPLFTGYTIDGGFAEFTVAFEDYCFLLPDAYASPSAAPLMCAGLIGFRSYNMISDECKNIGIYGFGAAAHILIQIARNQGKRVYAFTRPRDTITQQFAMELGAIWAGDSSASPPELLDAAIIFAPVGGLIPKALEYTIKGGTVICGGIYMSDIPSFPYDLLWGERNVKSVTNLTREDGERFFKILASIPVQTHVTFYPLEKANGALNDLRGGKINGAAVLVL